MTNESGSGEGLLLRIVRVFVTGPLAPLLLIVAAAVGAYTVLVTPREEDPQIVVPMADVLVSFPGASAAEVEQLVATPLEKLLWQERGVEHVYSISRRDGALVTARFFVGEDRERALVRLQSRIDAHRSEAPPGVTGWVVQPVDIDDVPILTLTLWSATADDAALRRVAEELAARLASTPDLSRTEIVGGRRREVRVEIDPEALAARELAPLAVAETLTAADVALAAGAFDRLDRHVPVVAGPFIEHPDDVGGLAVGASAERPVYVRDVARVVDGPEETDALVRVTFGAEHTPAGVQRGERVAAVTLGFAKKRGTNAVRVAEDVLARAAALAPTVLPTDVHMLVTRNYGETANEKVNELLRELGFAIVTVTGLVALALGWREGLIVAAAVPITFALTLFVNELAGYTINRVTLFALVLVLGLVCDDPIVDVENIHRHFALRHRSPLDAVLIAVNEVRPPVIVATLAVILSFLPMFFITGMMGPYMRPMALNVPVAMAMSLVVAFTITPWMAYHGLRREYDAAAAAPAPAASRLLRAYRTLLGRLLASRRARRALWAGLLVLAGLALLLLGSGAIPLKMLPYDNKSELQLVLDLPDGSTLAATDALVADVERYLQTVPEMTEATSYAGTASPIDFNGLVRRYGFRQAPQLADVRINLVAKERRAQQSHAIGLRVRSDLEAIARRHGAVLKIVEVPPGPPVLGTLTAEVRGPETLDHAALVGAARALAARLAAAPRIVDVDVLAERPHERLEFRLDKEKAALHGVTTAEAARTLQLALAGFPAATVHAAAERTPLRVVVRLDRAHRSGAEELGRLRVAGRGGALVPVAELGSFAVRTQEPSIYHKDLDRVVYVVADVAGRAPADAVFALERELAAAPLPDGAWADWSGEGEWSITVDVFRDLGIAFAAALLGIYVLLVAETRSFRLPLIIMLAIPLGLVGIAPGFWLLNLVAGDRVGGFPDPVWFTATAMIGMIALAGIVVRNAIILIDFIRARRAEGGALAEAVIEAGEERLRPIALTAGAAMLGAWPITLDPIFSGLAWSLIFGLVASTVFTLVVVPVAYHGMEAGEGA
ncbi:MAG: acriflavine resistance protein B [Polyangiaceae bacterium UTPRO1]|jgi:multidrug efflux pump subunit AcrB|nr:efflux RND transporter permease subunit [Myxococcales bacterium]OQY64771.1 MAG: acriflavine resistance protein B [Polyangiaceae bacterium UTPRO1]